MRRRRIPGFLIIAVVIGASCGSNNATTAATTVPHATTGASATALSAPGPTAANRTAAPTTATASVSCIQGDLPKASGTSSPPPDRTFNVGNALIKSFDQYAGSTSITTGEVETVCRGIAFPSGILVTNTDPADTTNGVPNTDNEGRHKSSLTALYVFKVADLTAPPVRFDTGAPADGIPEETPLLFVSDKALAIAYELPVQRDAAGVTVEPKQFRWSVFGTSTGTLVPLASGDGYIEVRNGTVVDSDSNTVVYTPS